MPDETPKPVEIVPTPAPAVPAAPAPNAGWKVRLASYLTGAYAVIAVGIYYLKGHDVAGALPLNDAIPLFLAGFGLNGMGHKIEKLIAVFKA